MNKPEESAKTVKIYAPDNQKPRPVCADKSAASVMEAEMASPVRVIVFAGTTEGYALCRFLSNHGIYTLACAATDYGGRVLTEGEFLAVRAERLDEIRMEELFSEIRPELVLDATHPYAAVVTENIRKACERAGFPYVRVLRQSTGHAADAVYVDSAAAAAEYLKGTSGNVLLTTGSKELAAFTVLPDYRERLYARVLSLPAVIQACQELGFEGKHLIGMQGPFSQELNEAMLRQLDCKYLVTKDTGKAGGFPEKIDAAAACRAVPVIIGRPTSEDGISPNECRRMLIKRFGLECRPKITLLGIGMGSPDTLTKEGARAAEEADLIIGAGRMVQAVAAPGQEILCEYRAGKIREYIEEHPEYERIVIALSGDVGFYSGARGLLGAFGPDVEMICGISSVVYFMAKIGLSWDDAKIVSAHGRSCNLIAHIRRNEKVFAILGTSDGVSRLAEKLAYYGMGDVRLYVGERLSYPDENIFAKPASELTGYAGDALSVICAVNPHARPLPATHGIPDGEFIRGKAPMTKEEVRWISLGKLRLQTDSVCWDVGAGTGSVSVEMALRAHQGKVYAIEKKEEAAALLLANKRKFAADNLEIVQGEAPAALTGLPVPTHVFLGGSSGNLREIVRCVLDKNPHARIVINCITLETVSETLPVLKEHGFSDTDIVQAGAARAKEVGRYHMMMGENPIYIITCQNEKTGAGTGIEK